MAQTVQVIQPKVPAIKAIDLNTPDAKHKVADLIKDADLCHLNLATTNQAYHKCSAETAPPLGFWQKPMGMVIVGLIGASVGALAYGYVKAN